MKNIHWFIPFLIMLLLSACVTETPAQSVNGAPIAPNVAAEAARQTKESYQAQEDLYNAQATSTSAAQTQIALAPIVAMTQTAGEFAMQQTYAQATTTSAALTQTAYANQQALIAQSTSTAGVATQSAAFTQQAFQVQVNNDNLALERARTVNTLLAMSPYAIGIVAMLLGVAVSFVLIKRLAYVPNPVDERGKPQPMFEVLEGVAYDIDRATNGMIGVSKKFLALLPEITPDRQNQTTARAQLTDLHTRVARIPRRLLETQSAGLLPEPAEEQEEVADMQAAGMLLPEWSIINGWNGQSRPLGLGAKGIIVAQAASPHLLTTGGTGSGKTAFMLRTQATISLAKGYQVINLGFSNSGFGVFSGHPNYYSVELNQSSDVIDCLASVYKELKERKQIIGGDSIEWEHWKNNEKPPRPFVDVLIDELGNLADDIYTSEETSKEGAVRTKTLWRWMSMIAKEGRKVGIRFIAALQDPTAKSVDLSFRRNCTLVSFQLGDASQSRSFIGAAGAELLQVGHFMTRNFSDNEGIVIGGGFAPSDDEIKAYLKQHSSQQTPPPAWIEGVVVSQPALPKQKPIELSAPKTSVTEFVNGLSEWEVKVLDLYEAGLDQIAIVESVFAGDDPEIGKVAVADTIKRWLVVKGATPADAPTLASNETKEPRKKTEQETIVELAEQIRARWSPALNKTQTSELLGKTYEGTSWVRKVNLVYAYLKSTTTPPEAPESPLNGGFQPSFQ